MKKLPKVDITLLVIISLIVISGFLVFLSASLGLTARSQGSFSGIVLTQLFFGLFLGSIAAFVLSRIKYTIYKKISIWLYFGALLLTLLVFVPGIGFEHGGAKRWILIAGFSFQPAELLKITFILYFATWLSNIKDKVKYFKFSVVPYALMVGIPSIVLLLQPDTSTVVVLATAGMAMLFVAKAKMKHIFILIALGLLALTVLAISRPYIKDRILTFIDPSQNPLTSGYQIQQSLIAIGSGGIGGRGFGQSLQKFNFLPEPIGDSIYAVAAEEFGFIGASFIILAFLALAIRGLKLASHTTDSFGGLVMVGIVILVLVQSFTNIGAMLGIIPLSGLPLIFISHGGSALLVSLSSIGILLNISRYQKK
jgi:cell division protein FtsW